MTKNNMAEGDKNTCTKIYLKNVLVLVLKKFTILFGVASEQLLSDSTKITFRTANSLHFICFKTCCKNVLPHDVFTKNICLTK